MYTVESPNNGHLKNASKYKVFSMLEAFRYSEYPFLRDSTVYK